MIADFNVNNFKKTATKWLAFPKITVKNLLNISTNTTFIRKKLENILPLKAFPPQLTNYIVSTINIEQKIYIGSIQFFLVGEVGLGPTFQ